MNETFEISAICLFNEGVRMEEGGSVTLIGVMNDGIGAPSLPNKLANLSIYTRIYVNPAFDPNPISIWVDLPEGVSHEIATFDPAMIDNARALAAQNGDPIAGFVSHISYTPFFAQLEGRILVRMKYASGEKTIGFLRIMDATGQSSVQPSPWQS